MFFFQIPRTFNVAGIATGYNVVRSFRRNHGRKSERDRLDTIFSEEVKHNYLLIEEPDTNRENATIISRFGGKDGQGHTDC